MGVWNAATPAGTDPINQGDDRIRELKAAVEEALSTEGSFPGAAPLTAPKFRWTPPRGNTASRPSTGLVTGQLYINTQLLALERYNGASWDIVDLTGNSTSLVAGDGLALAANTLSVNVGTGIEISSDAVRIAAAAAGDGLTGGGGSALAVNPDNSTIEINTDAVRVKDAGITEAKLATAVVEKLGQNIGLVARTSAVNSDVSNYSTVLSYSGQGRLDGIATNFSAGNGDLRITIDGVLYNVLSMSDDDHVEFNVGNSTDMFQTIASLGQLNELMLLFKTSILIEHRASGGGVMTTYVQYERQA